MRKKIILYNPRSEFFTMPLGLIAVASNLDPERYDVRIIDGRLVDDPLLAIKDDLDDVLCLGVTVLTGRPIHDALKISRGVKSLNPELPVVWGGWHPSLFPKACLDEPSIDVTVQAQGEATFSGIVERLAQKKDLTGVAGCVWRRDGVITENAPRPLVEMNEFAPASYALIDVERYFGLKGRRQLDYVTSTGCNFRCTFCADPFVFKRKWTALSPGRLADELTVLWQTYRFEDLHLQDETFFTHRKRVIEIAREFLRRGFEFTWTATLRADQGTRLEEEDFALCRRSGLRRVLVGVESGSQAMLDWMKKDITLEQIHLVAERCASHGIAVDFPMIVGFPGESEESVWSTLQLAKKLRAISPAFRTQILFYQPYPGSPISEAVEKSGYPLPATLDEWAEFDFVGSYGPWVSPEKWRLVQRFKFYSKHAWDDQRGLMRRPLQRLANWRCQHDFYHFPIEKHIVDWLGPIPTPGVASLNQNPTGRGA